MSSQTNHIEPTFFNQLDTEAKCYLLGWIVGNGYISKDLIVIKLTPDMHRILLYIFPYFKFINKIFYISSTELIKNIYRLLKIDIDVFLDIDILLERGDELKNAKMPKFDTEELKWSFIRGMYEMIDTSDNYRVCNMETIPLLIKTDIYNFCKIKHTLTSTGIIFKGVNSIDFLSKLYDKADLVLCLSDKYNFYLTCLKPKSSKIPRCYFVKMDKNSITPIKSNASDEGYDLSLIAVDKIISNNTIRYETGIKIKPEDGWHIELLPRSSLSSSGYMLSNSVGLIDESYRGTLKVVLTKVDQDLAKPIEFPFKAVQMVLRKSIHYICKETLEIDDTYRGDGGFGSTGDLH
jgi:dUTP pyrophosphatase